MWSVVSHTNIYISAMLRSTRQVCQARTLSVAMFASLRQKPHAHSRDILLSHRKRIRIIPANSRPGSRPLRSAQYTLLSWIEHYCTSSRLCPAVTADQQVADHCIKVSATRRCAFAQADSLQESDWLIAPVRCFYMRSKTACSSSSEQSQVVRLSSGNGALHFAQYPR